MGHKGKIYHFLPKQDIFAFDLKECAAHVSQDVRDKMAAHSSEYKRHKKALQTLEFPTDELTERQKHNANFFVYAVGELESVVCDGLWAASVLTAVQKPEEDFFDALDSYSRRLRKSEAFIAAESEVNQTFAWMKMCMNIENQERLEQYKLELFHGVYLVATGTISHGRRFGQQLVEATGLQTINT